MARNLFKTLGSGAGGIGGFLLTGGNPGGAALGSALGGSLGGALDGPGTPETTEKPRLQALLAVLEKRASGSAYDTDAFTVQTSQAREDAEDSAQDDAARASILGMDPGAAVAAGAGARSDSVARTTRRAGVDAERVQAGDRSALMQLLGVEIQGERYDRAMTERKKAGRNAAFTQLGTAALPYLLGGARPDSIYST